jgi:hypothetical protein
MVEDGLVAKALREMFLNEEAKKMIGNIEDLYEIWSMMEPCYV